jgi:hypothetical protein
MGYETRVGLDRHNESLERGFLLQQSAAISRLLAPRC